MKMRILGEFWKRNFGLLEKMLGKLGEKNFPDWHPNYRR